MRKRFSGKNLYRAPLLLGATLMLSACGLWQDLLSCILGMDN